MTGASAMRPYDESGLKWNRAGLATKLPPDPTGGPRGVKRTTRRGDRGGSNALYSPHAHATRRESAMLTSAELVVIGIICALFGMIALTRLKIELIAVIVLLMVAFSGLVPAHEVLGGFSSSVVITLVGLFIITRGLEKTGVIQVIARALHDFGRGSEVKLIALFMAAGAGLSLIMNNVAAGAALLPAAVRVARISGISVSKLLLPMSFGTLVGGMATYLTTANILMSELLLSRGMDGLGMLDFLPVGGLIVFASLVYMLLVGRRLLPERASMTQTFSQPDLHDTYQLAERMWRVRALAGGRLAGRSIAESTINAELGLTVAAVQRGGDTISVPKSSQLIAAGDELLIVGREERLERLLERGSERVAGGDGELPIEPIEIMIAPRSDAIGKTLSQLKLNRDAGLLAVALWRDGRSQTADVRKLPLRVGDAVLVVGQERDIERLSHNPDYILPAGHYAGQAVDRRRAPIAMLITAVALALSILNLVPLPIAMLGGAAAMVVSGCLGMDDFYAAVEWQVIFLVAGMLPLSLAITDSGLAERVGALLVSALSGAGGLAVVAGMALLTMLVVQVIGGQVTALLVGPLAINAALQMGVDARAMAVAVAMACSMAFLTPIAHPVNILMMGPGGYKFSDFSVVGAGMTAVTLAAMLVGLAWLWGGVTPPWRPPIDPPSVPPVGSGGGHARDTATSLSSQSENKGHCSRMASMPISNAAALPMKTF